MTEKKVLSIKDVILDIVIAKYPNLESKDNLTNGKLFDFRRLIDDDDNYNVIESMLISYREKTGNVMDADDILNIFKSYKHNPLETLNLKPENTKFYLEMARGIELEGIFALNRIFVSNMVIEKLKEVYALFDNEEEFRNYNDSLLITLLFRYSILHKTSMNNDDIVGRLKIEYISMLDKTIEDFRKREKIRNLSIH